MKKINRLLEYLDENGPVRKSHLSQFGPLHWKKVSLPELLNLQEQGYIELTFQKNPRGPESVWIAKKET